MLGAFRRGQALPKLLRACAPRVASSSSPFIVRTETLQAVSSPLRLAGLRQIHASSRLMEAVAAEAPVSTSQEPKRITKFQELEDLGLVSPNVIQVLTRDMKIETMTEVQSLTINQCLDGQDV